MIGNKVKMLGVFLLRMGAVLPVSRSRSSIWRWCDLRAGMLTLARVAVNQKGRFNFRKFLAWAESKGEKYVYQSNYSDPGCFSLDALLLSCYN